MKESDLTLFRTNIIRVRAFRGLTSRELSERAELRQLKRVSDIEEGRGKPTLEEVMAICRVLEVSIDEMLYRQPKIQF